MNAPRKIASLGFFEPDMVEAKFDEKLQEVEDAKNQARKYVAPAIVASLVVKYNAAQTAEPFNEWVVRDGNSIALSWHGNNWSLQKKVTSLYGFRRLSASDPGWPASDIARDITGQFDRLSRLPADESGFEEGIFDNLEAHVLGLVEGGIFAGCISIRMKS
jgi:hypothetical protein